MEARRKRPSDRALLGLCVSQKKMCRGFQLQVKDADKIKYDDQLGQVQLQSPCCRFHLISHVCAVQSNPSGMS